MHSPDGIHIPPADAKAPDIPGYDVLKQLGRGGMGIIYDARDLNLNLDRDVAANLLQDEPETDSSVYRGQSKSPSDFVDTNGDGSGELAYEEFAG